MATLNELFETTGQSAWIDDLKRSYLEPGGLDRLIALGVRGLTSNPTIMANAISSSSDYDAQFRSLIANGVGVEDAYWELVIADIVGAADLLRPVYDRSKGLDGFVSLEVSPHLATDTAGTIDAARELFRRVDRPNLMVKIPGTTQGLPAVEQMIAEGHSINVTLIFSRERYRLVAESYLRGLERLAASGGDVASVSSVASFFVSRIDTEVDRRLPAASGLAGKTAVAYSHLVYQDFEELFTSERFLRLTRDGARVQRPLWASTSTKNPSYPDLLYVEGLAAPRTVNTMTAATIEAFCDHGIAALGIEGDYDKAIAVLAMVEEAGVDLADVATALERAGLEAFQTSFDGLLEALEKKAKAF